MDSDASDAADSDRDEPPPKKKHFRFVDVLTEVPDGDASNATELLLTERGLTSVETLEAMKNLKKLELRGNYLSSLAFLEMSHGLCWLGMAKNHLRKITHLQNLSSLAVLDISDNRITRLEGLSGLSSLKALIAARNRIRRIEGLSPKQNPALETLVLSHNQISECSVVNYRALRKLSVAHNQLHAFPKLSRLPALAELRLNGNRICSVTADVAALNNLSILDIGNNLIVEQKGFEALKGLLWLKSLTLQGNAAADKASTMEAIVGSLPRLEIVNNKRQAGAAQGKRRHKHAQQEQKPAAPVPISVNGRDFQGRRAVFADDSADEEPAVAARPPASSGEEKKNTKKRKGEAAIAETKLEEEHRPAKRAKKMKKRCSAATEVMGSRLAAAAATDAKGGSDAAADGAGIRKRKVKRKHESLDVDSSEIGRAHV